MVLKICKFCHHLLNIIYINTKSDTIAMKSSYGVEKQEQEVSSTINQAYLKQCKS